MDEPRSFFQEFMPHGMCYVWEPTVLWLNVISDSVIALAYFFIPIALSYFLRQRADIPFRGVISMFTLFILACGITHTMGVWTVWHGHYGLHGLFKAMTALASLGCAAMLIPVMPKLLSLRSPAELESAISALEKEIKIRKEAESRALQILESAPDATVIIADNGEIEFGNARVEELFGYQRSELIGQPIKKLIPASFSEYFSGMVAQITQKEFHATRKNGDSFPVEVSLSPVGSAENPKISASIREISERVSVENQTQELQRDLAHLSRLRTVGALATGLAHELNQPLTAIVHNIDTAKLALEEAQLGHTEIPQLFSEIEASAHRASEIIRALRRFVGNENTEKSTVDINDLIIRTMRLVKREAETNLIEIKTILGKVEQPRLDPTQIAQVLVNLLKNGIEAISGAQSKVRQIVVQTTQTPDRRVCVSVADTGPGVESDFNFFEPFQSKKEDGLGIGLSISRSIIEAHGGTLVTEKSINPGAKFSFDLPLGGSIET